MLTACDDDPESTFPTSLHATFQGMRTFCEALDGDTHFIGSGIEGAYGVDYDDLGCKNCHDKSRPDAKDCNKCHLYFTSHMDISSNEDKMENKICLGCHSRQSKEAALEITDVHHSYEDYDDCIDCHSSKEMHGDVAGILQPYQSMWDPGARDTTCLSSDCHVEEDLGGAHIVHEGRLDCSACHIKTIITCYNCHFDTFMDSGEKKSMGVKKDWVFLVNDENGKVRTASFQSLVYKNESFIVFAPFHSHSVTKEARVCNECHNNEAIQQLDAEGKIVVTEWDGETLTHKEGVIPVVDGEVGELEFAYLNYDSTSETWSLIGTTTDNIQYGYCKPLTDEQIKWLKWSPFLLKQYIIDNDLMDAETLEKLKIE